MLGQRPIETRLLPARSGVAGKGAISYFCYISSKTCNTAPHFVTFDLVSCQPAPSRVDGLLAVSCRLTGCPKGSAVSLIRCSGGTLGGAVAGETGGETPQLGEKEEKCIIR